MEIYRGFHIIKTKFDDIAIIDPVKDETMANANTMEEAYAWIDKEKRRRRAVNEQR